MLLTKSAKGRNRTADTSIFSAVLYRLSYLGMISCGLLAVFSCLDGVHTIACLASSVNTLSRPFS